MDKQKLEQESKINQEKNTQLSAELNSLLEALVPYKFIFDARTSNNTPRSPVETITVKLNKERTLLCLEHNNNKFEMKNEDNNKRIVGEELYNYVRTTLQNNKSIIKENVWDESFKSAKQQILAYLIKKNKLEDRDGFLKEFQQFINKLPEVPKEFLECSRRLMEINFDDWDIDDSAEDDPRLVTLKELHKKMLETFEAYKEMGENYIQKREKQTTNDPDANTQEEKKEEEERKANEIAEEMQKKLGINMFNVEKIPGDGNCFYSAVADQLERLEIKRGNNETNNQLEEYYTHQDLRALAINYIKENKEQEFGKDLTMRLQAKNTDPLHGDLPANIDTIDQYIERHSKEGEWADSGMVGALGQALDITLRIYQDGKPATYNASQEVDSTIKKIVNLQYTGNHYNSLVVRPLFELLPFESKYPKQSNKIKRIFEILNGLERCKDLDEQIGIIAGKLGLPPESTEKLKAYFNASKTTKPQKTNNFGESGPWYTDEDMNFYGKVLEKHGVNFENQFSNRLTKDGIKTLPSIESLIENEPRYICYNIGGSGNKDNSGMHWVAIVLVKRDEKITILYKDPKGDWNNSSKDVEKLFKERYGEDKVEFIKHLQDEQKDDSSCGPMTINNLEIMAVKVKEANAKNKDGIAELIEVFKSGGVDFTTQDQVESVRREHLENKLTSKANLKKDTNIDDTDIDNLETIIKKLQLTANDLSMEDGKNFNLVTIKGDGNCFYSAVADQLKRLEIKKKSDTANNQPEDYYTPQDLRELTVNYIKNNKEKEFGKDLKKRLQAKNANPLHGDLPANIHTIDQYIEHHSKEGEWADSGTVGALTQALDITLRIYQDGKPGTYNTSQEVDSTVKKIVNLQYTGNHYNSLVDVEDSISKKKEEIESYVRKIDEYYNKLELKDWGIDKLKDWSLQHKGKLSKNFNDSTESGDKICEAIAVMDRANELATPRSDRLRDAQKAAILIFMQTNEKGHISQINTGEGKTTIISVVTALKVMQGYQAHVITSNNVLAAEGVKDRQLFYSLLKIAAADNNPDDDYTDGPRACYRKDIVYGSITSFQFDWLRDSFEQLKTLGGIDFNNIWVMLDEIDSLLIDQGSNIAKLSGPFPGMESLRYVYINIWVALAKAEEQVTQQILEKLKTKSEELDQNSEINEDKKQLEYEECEDGLRESFLNKIKTQITSQKDSLINKQLLAKHLHQYAEDSVERWIEHAFTAKYQYNENVEYKIGKDKDGENIIIPIDNQNTGVSMKNTILSNGLHQFLQIKHNLCLTYESLTSCYVSNLDYIKKYGNKLSGVTGTLGSKPERDLLGSVFELEFSVVPPFKPKHFIQFPGKVCADDDFINCVAIAALGELVRTQIEDKYIEETQLIKSNEIETPRAIEIICASILDVEIIAKEIEKEAKSAGLTPNILKYRDESDADVLKKRLKPYDIVIATNLGGRGTDIKTSHELEKNGGLDIIEAFLPSNQRVGDQGFGRTSRQGNKGTGRMIIRASELEVLGITVKNNENIDFNEIIKLRDKLETRRVKDITDNKIIELEFKGQLFNEFSSQYGALKEKNKIGTDVIKWIYVLRDLKEKWAFWLEKQAYTAENIKQIINPQQSSLKITKDDLSKAVKGEYNKFLEEVDPIIKGTISHNPYYSICLAERYLANITSKSDREKAKSELEHALEISESSELLYSAYIKLFEIAIEDGGQVLERYKKAVAKIFFYPLEKGCPHYKINAKENLEKAQKALAIEHDYLEELISGKKTNDAPQEESVLASIIISGKQGPDANNQQDQGVTGNSNLFIKHLQARLMCLAAYKGNIESLIEQIQIDGKNKLINEQDSIGLNDGAIIDAKVPRYLSKLDSQNPLKKHITDREVNELEYVGTSSIYQLRKIHDVHEEVILGAQIQIGGAFALLVSATVFPFLLPVNGPLASAMISEGITDIITALIQQGQSSFNKKDYIKGKIISYGITLLTMGIGAIMSSTKILTKAMNACRNLAAKLRAVTGPFAGICKFLANQLDKLAKYLELMIEKIEFARKMAVDQASHLTQLKDLKELERFQQLQKTLKISDVVMTHGQKITQIVTQSVIGAVKGVVISVAIERIVIAGLNNLMAGLQPKIKEKVHDAVRARIIDEYGKGKFNNLSDSKINEAIRELFKTSLEEDIKDVAMAIGLGIMRHSSNWKMQLATLAADTVLTGIDIATCTKKICGKFIDSLDKLPKQQANNINRNDSEKNTLIDNITKQISEPISDILYGKIVAITGKAVVTLPKVFYRGYKEHQEAKADKKAIADIREKLDHIDTADEAAKAASTKCAHDAVAETLGLDKDKGSKQLADAANLGASEKGASIEDIKQLFEQTGIGVTSCSEQNPQAEFQNQSSDRGVVCLSGGDNVTGHAIAVTMENNCLMVTENGKKIPLEQYKKDHGYTNAEVIIPKGVNSETLPAIQHKCNLNRIIKATHPIGYVGQEDGMKFGGEKNISKTGKNATQTTQTPSTTLEQSVGGDVRQEGTDGATPDHFNDIMKEFNTLNSSNVVREEQNSIVQTKQYHIDIRPLSKDILKIELQGVQKGIGHNRTIAQVHMSRSDFGNFPLDMKKLSALLTRSHDENKILAYIFDKPQKGLNTKNLTALKGNFPSFYEYTMNGITKILNLRARIKKLKNVIILPEQYIFSSIQNNIVDIFSSVRLNMNNIYNNRKTILAPISLYNKHAVGIMFVSQETKANQNPNAMEAFYIDPSNGSIPEGLKIIFSSNGYTLEQLPTEGQKYTNCGPEVIENFMLYLTGERLSQEEAIVYNSKLVEQELLSGTTSDTIKDSKNIVTLDLPSLGYSKKNLDDKQTELMQRSILPIIKDRETDNITQQRFFAQAISKQLANERLANEQLESKQAATLTTKELEATNNINASLDDKAAQILKLVEVTPITTTHQITFQNSCQNPLSQLGLYLYTTANKLSNEAWYLENENNSENSEDSAIIAAEKFAKSLELYREALEIEPENKLYQKAFNIISLKIEGNDLFNEGVALTDIAYQLQLALLSEDSDTSRLLEQQQAVVGKYQEVLNAYQEAQDRFYQGFILCQDHRFQSCIELVESEIEFIENHIASLEKLAEEWLAEGLEQDDSNEMIQEPEDEIAFAIELYNQNNEILAVDNVLLGNNYPVESQYIYQM